MGDVERGLVGEYVGGVVLVAFVNDMVSVLCAFCVFVVIDFLVG